jgi:hypothetical protein
LSAGPGPQGSPSRSPHGLGQAGDRIHRHGPPPPGPKVAGLAGDLRDLGGVGEAQAADADGFEGAQLHAAVGAVVGAVQRPTVVGLLDTITRNSAASRWVCRASAVLLHTTRPYLTNRTYPENAGALLGQVRRNQREGRGQHLIQVHIANLTSTAKTWQSHQAGTPMQAFGEKAALFNWNPR